jgi:class 3 adenylate cyclase
VSELHGGTVTFLFTDIEGSTRLLQELADGGSGRMFAFVCRDEGRRPP